MYRAIAKSGSRTGPTLSDPGQTIHHLEALIKYPYTYPILFIGNHIETYVMCILLYICLYKKMS